MSRIFLDGFGLTVVAYVLAAYGLSKILDINQQYIYLYGLATFPLRGIFKIFIYPFFFSPLRRLPEASVSVIESELESS